MPGAQTFTRQKVFGSSREAATHTSDVWSQQLFFCEKGGPKGHQVEWCNSVTQGNKEDSVETCGNVFTCTNSAYDYVRILEFTERRI